MSAVIIWILAFMFLVIIHELGHFGMAKKFWVKVLEFGIWIPPKLFKFWTDKSWTEYSANIIPLWWFVRLKWEDPDDTEDFHAKDSLISASFMGKVWILLWGVIMNLLFAWIVFVIAFWRGFSPMYIISSNFIDTQNNTYITPTTEKLIEDGYITWESLQQSPIIWEVLSWSLGQNIWLISWDNIITINGQVANNINFRKILWDSIWSGFVLNVQRWSGEVLNITWTCPTDNCVLWVIVANWPDLSNIYIKKSFGESIIYWAKETYNQVVLSYKILGKVFGGMVSGNFKSSVNKLSGPAGAIKFSESILQTQPVIQYFLWMAMISLSLAIFNILPIPALDGGRLLWFIIQKVFWLKPESYFRIEWYMNFVFFWLMMWLGIYILLKDLISLRWINIPFF